MAKPKTSFVQEELKVLKRPHAIYFEDRSRAAKQSFKEQCDVQRTIEIFQKTGQLVNQRTVPGVYGDFTKVPDFRTAQIMRIQAQRFYDNLPKELVGRFKNIDEFYKYCADSKNQDELIKFGLLKAKPVVEPEKVQKVEVVNSTKESVSDSESGAKAKPSAK